MNKWNTCHGFKIIQILGGRSNAYLIIKGDKVILVDSGRKNAFKKLLKRMDSIGMEFSKVSHLILTHTHYDHCESANKIKNETNCYIVVSQKASDSIVVGYTLLPGGSFPITDKIVTVGKKIGKRVFGYEPFHGDILIDRDTYLDIGGFCVQLIETPGHSDDSIAIIVDDEIAIVGDTLLGRFKNSVFPPFADDVPKMINSWGKLLQTKCKIFLPGHGYAISRELLQKEYDRYKGLVERR